jgi:hypothetical protein
MSYFLYLKPNHIQFWLVDELFQITMLFWIVPVYPDASQAKIVRWKSYFRLELARESNYNTLLNGRCITRYMQMERMMFCLESHCYNKSYRSLKPIAFSLPCSFQVPALQPSITCVYPTQPSTLLDSCFFIELFSWGFVSNAAIICTMTCLQALYLLYPSSFDLAKWMAFWPYTKALFCSEVPTPMKDVITRHWDLRKVVTSTSMFSLP